jgi:hypothetical protein
MTLARCSATRRSASGVMSCLKRERPELWLQFLILAYRTELPQFGIFNSPKNYVRFAPLVLSVPQRAIYVTDTTYAEHCTGLATKSTCLHVPLRMAQQSLYVCTYRYVWHNKVYMSVRTVTYGTTKSTCLYEPLRMAQPSLHICTYHYIWHNKVYMSVRTSTYGTTKSTYLYVPLRMAQQSLHVCTNRYVMHNHSGLFAPSLITLSTVCIIRMVHRTQTCFIFVPDVC